MIKTLIVDDEKYARKNLAVLIESFCPELEVVGMAENVVEAIKLINKEKPDLVMLDIEMRGGSGFDLLACFTERSFKVVFVTAYDSYAIKAFQVNALDYLLKPIDPLELKRVVKQMQDISTETINMQIDHLLDYEKKGSADKIGIPIRNGIQFVTKKEIIYLEASGNYTTLYFNTQKPVVVSRNLKTFENVLESPAFMRVHRAYIVNLQSVEAYLRSNGGELLMPDKKTLGISKSRLDEVLDALKKVSVTV